MIDSPLGKIVAYKDLYDNSLLVGIPRSETRTSIGLGVHLPFTGVDIWNCYEVSWLNTKGKPCVRIVQLIVPADSKNILESKSLKLYLNSFYGTKFESDEEVRKIIQKDCSNIVGKNIEVKIKTLAEFQNQSLSTFEGHCIDDLDIEITDYKVDIKLLKPSREDYRIVEETLYSNLLKSNCLVTNQPDFASVQIKYRGRKFDYESLLRYLVSFRNHNEFHEQCVEHIFCDLILRCSPMELTVHAKYTRRGGIDINPYRTTSSSVDIAKIDAKRDVRQ
jgi:7-cyano-7-deazaguanine reductase